MNNFCNANLILKLIIDSRDFKGIVKDIYGNDVKVSSVKNMLSVYDKIEKKLYKRPKVERKDSEKRETHFTKHVDPTDKSKHLFNLVKDHEKLSIKNDQTKVTSYSDVRTMIYSYIRNNDLKDQELGTRVDNELRRLAPESLKNVEYITKKDGNTTIHRITKEIL